MSEHRRWHASPFYTGLSIGSEDIFTVTDKERAVVYKNSIKLREICIRDACSAVSDGVTLFYSLKYNNRIYSLDLGTQSVMTSTEISDCKSVRIWKYLIEEDWLVLETSDVECDLNNSENSNRKHCSSWIYSIKEHKNICKLPVSYVVDFGLVNRNTLEVIVLGDECDGEEYLENGDGPVEDLLIRGVLRNGSPEFEERQFVFETKDFLQILSFYDDDRDPAILSRPYTLKNMDFPLFDKYWHCWLDLKALSAYSKYVIYYCRDIKGVIISEPNGQVYRIFELPQRYRKTIEAVGTSNHLDDLFFFFNEKTSIFTVINEFSVKRYLISLRQTEMIETLNRVYHESQPDRSQEGLRINGDFVNLLYRTIHAIKCQDLSEMRYDYDVALSFAGEDRDYVEQVLHELELRQIRVFYDRKEQSSLWGRDLTLKLDEIYRTDTKFCMVFCSQHYLEKRWPAYESKCYRAGQFENRRDDYILPVKLDDAEIPGLHTTLGYLDARVLTPKQIADEFVTKLSEFEE